MKSRRNYARYYKSRKKDEDRISLTPIFLAFLMVFAIGIRFAKSGPFYSIKEKINEVFGEKINISEAAEVLGRTFSGEDEENAVVVFGKMILGLDEDKMKPTSKSLDYIPKPSASTAGDISGLTLDIPESPMPEADDCAAFWAIAKEDEYDGTPNREFRIPSPDKVDDTVYKPGFKLINPLKSYRMTSKFGYRVHPISGNTTFHYGVDLAAPSGTKIMSAADGTVSETGVGRINGNYVKISHADGFSTHYCHMKNINVKRGQKLSAGQVIGTVGSTGYSTGPHLHFEIRKNNRILNPFSYFSF